MRNRKWTALMLAGVMSLSLMACGENAVNSSEEPSGEPVQEATGNETEDGGDETKEPSGEKVELTGMVQQSRWYSGLQNMVDKLAEQENIHIEFEVIPDDQYDNLMKMRLNSHEAPDLIVYQFADLFAGVNPEEFLFRWMMRHGWQKCRRRSSQSITESTMATVLRHPTDSRG